MHNLSIKIADLAIDVASVVDFQRFNDFNFYKDFITDEAGHFHCRLEHEIGPPPDFTEAGVSFNADNWQLCKRDGKNVLRVGPPPKRGPADNVVVFNSDYNQGRMYQKSVFELFRRFIDQFLVINLLSQRAGFLLHASGVIWEGKGLCFVGPSGAGKSTLLDLFGKEVKRECLLNDDRLALRKYDKKWRVFGTPWYGESRVSSSGGAGLRALFFIRHSKHNYLRKLSLIEALQQLIIQALMPVWDEEATSRVLGTFQCLLQEIPTFEMGFLPDKSAIELVKKAV